MKKHLALLLSFALCLSLLFTGCKSKTETKTTDYVGTYSKQYAGTVLNVFNWGEYISDGSDNSLNVNKAFEDLTGIKVNYSNYDSNEAMYTKLKSGGVSYDIIIPSDYMVERLIKENLIQDFNASSIENYKNISDKYRNLYFDPENQYSVPYNVGMVGLIYNTKMVKTPPTSWNAMWDKTYTKNILTFNNPRDAFAIAQFLLGQSINTENIADWNAAAEKLKEQKPILQSYVMDEIYDKMEGGEAAMAPYYAGDYLFMHENNPDLAFVYPSEGTNIFVDSVCIPKGASNVEAAKMYVNFLLEPKIALANAEYTCYASPNTSVLENDEYSLKDNKILYPSEKDMPKTEYFHDVDASIRSLYEQLWDDVKLSKYK